MQINGFEFAHDCTFYTDTVLRHPLAFDAGRVPKQQPDHAPAVSHAPSVARHSSGAYPRRGILPVKEVSLKLRSCLLVLLALSVSAPAAQARTVLDGLHRPVFLIRDASGIPHIFAADRHDLFYVQGWVHAQDRLFQMDLFRRQVAGTLAEVLGAAALERDVISRTLGLGPAAQRSLDAHPQSVRDDLQAYSEGVNAYIDRAEADATLPPEYGALALSSVARWKPLDSELVAKAIAATTSLLVADDIELTVALGAYRSLGAALGIDGDALFFEDLFRSAPFDPASTVPDAERVTDGQRDLSLRAHRPGAGVSAKAMEQARAYLQRVRKLPRLPGVPEAGQDMGGSNTWVVGPRHAQWGHALLANDIHLALDTPPIFYDVHLVAPGLNVIGSSAAGTPCVIRGHNRHLAWGVTNSRLDISDVYAETIVVDATSPSGLSILHNGTPEPIVPRLEAFFYNPLDGSGLARAPDRPVLSVPRRNNGPLITAPAPDPDTGALSALSLQSTAFSATRDIEGFCALNRARNLAQFKAALRLIDFGSQNITYADRKGNIAYFTTGEVPLREDLQAMSPAATPPFLIRRGSGGQEWLPATGPLPAEQAVAFEILPFEEMPGVENPASGLIVNANNDQVGNTLDNNPLNDLRPGGGLRYLNWGGRNFSIRAGRIDALLRERLAAHHRLSLRDMQEIQADTVLGDAQVFVPFIVQAFANAVEPGAHPALAALADESRIAEALERLRRWNFTTPSGLAQGHDADPAGGGVDASVSATLFAVWRGRLSANTIDAVLDTLLPPTVPRPTRREEIVTALRHLLESDPPGVGVSGLDFFNVPGVEDAATRRDILILKSLRDALELLASDAFAPAFARSVDQDDYRWGKLHRLVLASPLGDVFDVPPAFGLFPPPLAGLDGIPVDGGFETIDQAPPLADVRAADSDALAFRFGPTGRFVSRLSRHRVEAHSSLPGGESAVPFTPFYLNLLEGWLDNETYPLPSAWPAIVRDAFSRELLVPSR